MKKSVKRIACLALACFTAFPLFACGDEGGNEGGGGDKTQKHNPEEQPLVLSTDALDGKFNPFYATSATDVTIAAQTQISMLSLDEKGNIVCGENEPTVALDYKYTMFDEQGNATNAGSMDGYTEYEFVIKNGIKYSDGNDLTIDDVLFNLYVYLDPLYMGSATIYSTKIQGLTAYRKQEPGADNDGSTDQKKGYYEQADRRIRHIRGEYCGEEDMGNDIADAATMAADFALAKKLFKEEVESDWTANYGTLESYEEEYNFTEDWQVYYYNAGLVSVEYKQIGSVYEPVKDENGKYVTTLDEESKDYDDLGKIYIDEMAAALEGLEKGSLEYTEAMRQKAIETVYNSYVLEDNDFMDPTVLKYWSTGDKLREEIAAQLLDDYYKSLDTGDGMPVKNISGISHYNTSEKAFTGGKMNSKLDSDGHDVLKIVIDGIDPKAIYNFSFSVSPMHYYGDGNSVCDGKYDDYYKKANGYDNFGVAFGEKDFFDKVLQAPEKTGVPVGAGAYMACDKYDTGSVNSDSFWSNNIVYYKRNSYFNTVGKELSNAKIKYLRYQVTSSDQIMNALASGDIHFGTPNATDSNIEKMADLKDKLNHDYYETNGYGYVGINAKYVPDIAIRRIIMRTMNLDYPKAYYKSHSKYIYRSMSLTSWYYPSVDGKPESAKVNSAYAGREETFYEGNLTYYGLENDTGLSNADYMEETIEAKLTDLGYTEGGDGIRVNSDGEKLEYVFTIAGASDDHPAYTMFQESARILNKCGFKITVRRDPQALIKLASGELQVWAAAWSSAIDPDMYQVYHRDSTATSVKNWGYDEIFKSGNEDKYATEIGIINELSTLIEDGRETLDTTLRFQTYTKALDLVMELAVEFPTYQRDEMFAYDKTLIDASTINQDPSTNSGPLDRIWEVNYL